MTEMPGWVSPKYATMTMVDGISLLIDMLGNLNKK